MRLGKGNDGWALALSDVELMVMNGRAMHGWVRAGADAYGDDAVRKRLHRCGDCLRRNVAAEVNAESGFAPHPNLSP